MNEYTLQAPTASFAVSLPEPSPCTTRRYEISKILVDVPTAVLALILLAPVLLAIAAVIRITSSGPVLFKQPRVGRHGRIFGCLKFRTMRPDAEALLRADPALYQEYLDNDFKLPPGKDPRITPLGAFLRSTSLDELPQLWNVVRGEMSLVGPRPVVPAEITHYEHAREDFLSAYPGLTGLWQVSGRSDLAYPERAHLEIDYVRRWSFLRDLWILAKTIIVVFRRTGAF